MKSGFLRNGGQFWKSIRHLSENILSYAIMAGYDLTKASAMKLAKMLHIGLFLIFVYIDIKSIIYLWKYSNPTVEDLSDRLKILESKRKKKEKFNKLR